MLCLLFLNKKEQIPHFKIKQNLVETSYQIEPSKEAQNNTIQLVQQFSIDIGKIQNDPVVAELRMRTAAQDLPKSDYSVLEKIILDTGLNQDDRFVALTLLTWSNNANVASTLVKIATSGFDPVLNPNQKSDFEKILRMSAVEGLSEIPLQPFKRIQYLNQILVQTELEPIVDRAMRSLWAEQKLAMSVVDQDKEALKKLLSSP